MTNSSTTLGGWVVKRLTLKKKVGALKPKKQLPQEAIVLREALYQLHSKRLIDSLARRELSSGRAKTVYQALVNLTKEEIRGSFSKRKAKN